MHRLLAIFIMIGILICSNALYAGSGSDEGTYVFPSAKRYTIEKPDCISTSRVRLRNQSQTISEPSGIASVIWEYDFYHYDYNKFGKFLNDFKANPDGTVTARATGLMWQASGSEQYRTLDRVHGYIEELNRKQFAGYRDWRLPTIEELASLVQEKEHGGFLYIDTELFGQKHLRCWSTDQGSSDSTWYVSFLTGRALWIKIGHMSQGFTVRAVRSVN